MKGGMCWSLKSHHSSALCPLPMNYGREEYTLYTPSPQPSILCDGLNAQTSSPYTPPRLPPPPPLPNPRPLPTLHLSFSIALGLTEALACPGVLIHKHA